MLGPLIQAEATLLPIAHRPRLIPGWRPTVALVAPGTSDPDLHAPALGIGFFDGPGQAQIGSRFFCTFRCIAWPDPLCQRLTAGVEFAFLEGTTVVGVGKVVAVGPTDGA